MPRELEEEFWGEAGAVTVKVWRQWNRFLLVDGCDWVVFLGSACVEICSR